MSCLVNIYHLHFLLSRDSLQLTAYLIKGLRRPTTSHHRIRLPAFPRELKVSQVFSEGSAAHLILLQVFRIKTRFLAQKLEPTSHVSNSATDLFQLIISNTRLLYQSYHQQNYINGTKTNSFQVRFISVFSGQFSRSRRYDSIIDRGSKMTRVLLKLWSHFAIRLHLDMCSLEFKHKKLQYILYPQQKDSVKTHAAFIFRKKSTLTRISDALAWQGQIPQLLPFILR